EHRVFPSFVISSRMVLFHISSPVALRVPIQCNSFIMFLTTSHLLALPRGRKYESITKTCVIITNETVIKCGGGVDW
ncbi:hypothetical protein L9F63_020714, partial [Diploptera punctata]